MRYLIIYIYIYIYIYIVVTIYYEGDHIKDGEIGRACGTSVGEQIHNSGGES